jgi:hypothetical protein
MAALSITPIILVTIFEEATFNRFIYCTYPRQLANELSTVG